MQLTNALQVPTFSSSDQRKKVLLERSDSDSLYTIVVMSYITHN
jgi:hypothetical protein